MDFEGWVPNATGNISFSAIGDPLTSGLLKKQHLPLSTRRWIVLCQNRRNRDRQVPRWLANALRHVFGPRYPDRKRVKRYETLTYSLMAASTPIQGDAEGALDGTITISFPGTASNDRLLKQIHQTSLTLYSGTEQLRAGQDVVPPSDGIWNGAVAVLRDNSTFDCTFRMLRNGKSFFHVDGERHKLDGTTMHWLMSQCFYFLKDAVHQHYHHRQATDAIIELAVARASPDWRFKTLRNLYRKVISLRRSRSERLLSDALGVMAYANVFMDIFRKRDFGFDGSEIEPAPGLLPTYHSDQLRGSIEIRRDSARRDYDRRKNEFQYWIGALLTIGVISVATYDRFIVGSPARLAANYIFRTLSYYPLALVVATIVFYFIYALTVGVRDPAESWVVRAMYRLFAWFSKPAGVAIGAILTVGLLGIAMYCLWRYLTA